MRDPNEFDDDYGGFYKGRTPKFIDHILPNMILFLAGLLCLYGTIEMYNLILGRITLYWCRPLEAALYIACGLIIFLDKRRKFIRSIGFYAIAIGGGRIISAYPYLQGTEEFMFDTWIEMLISANVPISILGVIYIGIGANTLISGVEFARGTTHGKTTMQISAAIMCLLYLEGLGLSLATGRQWEYLFNEESNSIVRILLYFSLIWLLDTDEVRYGDKVSKHFNPISDINNTYHSRDFITVDEKCAADLYNGPGSEGWTPGNEGSPVEHEYRFSTESEFGITYVTVQKWKDSDLLYFTLKPHDKGSFVYADRFSVEKMFLSGPSVEESDEIRMLGKNHTYLQIPIIHPEKECEADA